MLNLMLTCLLVQAGPVDVTIMSFNIRYDNPDDGDSAWRYRIKRVADEMAEADLIGVQEALSHQVKHLAEELSGYEWVGVGRDDGKKNGEFTSVFFKASAFELLESTTFWLSETPDEPGSVGWDAALPRIATSVHLRVRGTEFDFRVINTHFDHRGTQARLQSAKLLAERVRESTGPKLLLGDLNTTPDTDVFALFLEEGGLRDAYTVSKMIPKGPVGTFSGFLEQDQLNEAPRIDYILVSSHWNVCSYENVVSVQNGRYVSDHLPVKVWIRFMAPCTDGNDNSQTDHE